MIGVVWSIVIFRLVRQHLALSQLTKVHSFYEPTRQAVQVDFESLRYLRQPCLAQRIDPKHFARIAAHHNGAKPIPLSRDTIRMFSPC